MTLAVTGWISLFFRGFRSIASAIGVCVIIFEETSLMDESCFPLAGEVRSRLAAILKEINSPAGVPPIAGDVEFVRAVLLVASNGMRWRVVPAQFGNWDAVRQRQRRWNRLGIWHAQAARPLPEWEIECSMIREVTMFKERPLAMKSRRRLSRPEHDGSSEGLEQLDEDRPITRPHGKDDQQVRAPFLEYQRKRVFRHFSESYQTGSSQLLGRRTV